MTASSRTAVLLVVLAALAVALTMPRSAAPAAREPTTGGAPVTRTDLGCPAPGRAGAVRLGLVRGPAGSGAVRGGTVEWGPVTGPLVPQVLARGPVTALTVDQARGGPRVRADGPAAAGLVGFRTDRGPGPSLAVTSCGSPRSEWWFTGAGAGLDHSSTLLLANLDPGPAVVDLRVLGPDGELRGAGTRGVVVAPHSQRRVDLSGVAPQVDDLALGVHASRGRVVAAVDDSLRSSPTAPEGLEWLAATDRPARRLQLAGIPRVARGRTLLVANPSTLEAAVEVGVSGASGTFTPTGLDPVTVAPGAIEAVDVSRVVPSGEPAGIRLRSRVPVVAALRSGTANDHAYAVPAQPVVGAAAASLVAGARSTVQLAAGSRAVRAAVAAYDARGRRVDQATVRVGAGATRGWTPRGGAYVVVTPRGGGQVRGAVVYVGGGLAAVPLTSLPLREPRPVVRPGLR